MRYAAICTAVCLLATSARQASAVGIAAGTLLEVTVDASYLPPGMPGQITQPVSVVLTVVQVAGGAVELGAVPDPVTPGQAAYAPLRIRNTGNGVDTFNLSITSSSGWAASLVYDSNADGVRQTSETTTITSTGSMVADGYCPCFARVVVPSGASTGATFSVRATSILDAARATALASFTMNPPRPGVAIELGTVPDPITAGQATYTPLRIRNTGSVVDTFNLSITSSSGWAASLIRDSNADGVRQTSETTTITSTGSMAAEGYCPCFARVVVPSGASTVATFSVKATSTLDATRGTAVASFTIRPPNTLPVDISIPTRNTTYQTAQPSVDLAGTARYFGGVTRVEWSSDRGGSGTCAGTTAWNAAGIGLKRGPNVITVTAYSVSVVVGSDALTVAYTPETSFPVPIGSLKTLPDGGWAEFSGAVVIAASGLVDGGFYAEAPDRTSGIRVLADRTVAAGDIVGVSGVMTTVGTERAVQAYDIVVLSSGSGLPEPLGIRGKQILRMPDTIGKIVRCWGGVTAVDSSSPARWFVIDDGSLVPVKCLCAPGITPPASGFVAVSGVCSINASTGGPMILVHGAGDIRVLN